MRLYFPRRINRSKSTQTRKNRLGAFFYFPNYSFGRCRSPPDVLKEAYLLRMLIRNGGSVKTVYLFFAEFSQMDIHHRSSSGRG